jgi:hypothetical protein
MSMRSQRLRRKTRRNSRLESQFEFDSESDLESEDLPLDDLSDDQDSEELPRDIDGPDVLCHPLVTAIVCLILPGYLTGVPYYAYRRLTAQYPDATFMTPDPVIDFLFFVHFGLGVARMIFSLIWHYANTIYQYRFAMGVGFFLVFARIFVVVLAIPETRRLWDVTYTCISHEQYLAYVHQMMNSTAARERFYIDGSSRRYLGCAHENYLQAFKNDVAITRYPTIDRDIFFVSEVVQIDWTPNSSHLIDDIAIESRQCFSNIFSGEWKVSHTPWIEGKQPNDIFIVSKDGRLPLGASLLLSIMTCAIGGIFPWFYRIAALGPILRADIIRGIAEASRDGFQSPCMVQHLTCPPLYQSLKLR